MSDMEAVEAAQYLREAIKKNPDLAKAMTAVVDVFECDDIYDWADQNPKLVKMMVTDLKAADEQFDEYDRRLAEGDLS